MEPAFDTADMTAGEISEVFDYTGVNLISSGDLALDVATPRLMYAFAALNRRRIDGDDSIPIDFIESEGLKGKEIGEALNRYLGGEAADENPTSGADDAPLPDPTPDKNSGSRGSRRTTASARGKSTG